MGSESLSAPSPRTLEAVYRRVGSVVCAAKQTLKEGMNGADNAWLHADVPNTLEAGPGKAVQEGNRHKRLKLSRQLKTS